MKADLAWTRGATLQGRRLWVQSRSRDVTSILNTRIAIVLAVIVGQLWGLKLALDAWFGGQVQALWTIVAFQAVSTAITFALSRAQGAPERAPAPQQ